jgi:hypothetical protein
VNKRYSYPSPEPGATPVTSAASAFSGFDFLDSLRLCVSAVNT